ncbi:hypothetical protein HLB44_21530 [Aquincola sp. S2]|uniref:Helicase ATP-binding domain-containing protein n=1 Tax=Pseudaquabacterium terrae TaxID=2732868 RepID=A0ABX2ELR1_9BURK|nr:hypothetical protein [Aquabacterium terrae]NRF69589.1 hypothetical protein [Aquabacterium terrae]
MATRPRTRRAAAAAAADTPVAEAIVPAAPATPAAPKRPRKTAAARAEPAAEVGPPAAAPEAIAVEPAPPKPAPRERPPARTKAEATPAPVKPATRKLVTEKVVAKKAAAEKTPVKKAPAKKARPAAEPEPAAARKPARKKTATPAADLLPPAQPSPPAPPAPPAGPPPPPDSAIVLVDGDQRHLRWIAGGTCPPAVRQAAAARVDADGHLRPDDDEALPLLLRLADEAGHALHVDPAAWLQLAHHRDTRHRLHQLETAYPEGPTSPALQALLRAPLAPFQAEGALFATCAGRTLIADERGLGKTVQALAVAVLLHRHAGVRRVLLRCTPARRLSWQREWARFVRDGGLELQIVDTADTAEAAAPPDLVLIDEPQRLETWDSIDAPFALVLCGADLDTQPDLVHALVRFLDRHRLGSLARLSQAPADAGAAEPLDERLQLVMLRRRRSAVSPQLPSIVQSERVLTLAAPQRTAHDRALAEARGLLERWRRAGRLADAEQWQLGVALRAARTACHRADPESADSPLAEATLAALQDLLGELRGTPGLRIALVCPNAADRVQLERRLAIADRLALVLDGAALPPADVVIRIGTPWRPADTPGQCIHLVADASLDSGLFDTLGLRADVPCGPVEGGRDGFLQGARLQRYLLAAEAAVHAAG